MSKFYLAAFVVVMGGAVAGVDYVGQARKAGSTPGAFAVSDYIDTVASRFGAQKRGIEAATERRTLLAGAIRDNLPEAPEGWTRRDWDPAAAAALGGTRYDMQDDEFLPDEMKENVMLRAMSKLDKAAGERRDGAEVYVYEAGENLISLRLSHTPGRGLGGLSGVAMNVVANNVESMSGKDGFAIVQGVTYREEHGMFGVESGERAYRVLTGQLGKEIRIGVRARADDATILDLLNRIDYDRLNRMLEVPLPGIGSDAPVIAEADMQAEADRRVEAAAREQRYEAEMTEIRMMDAALTITRRTSKMSDAEFEVAKGALEKRKAAIEARNPATAKGGQSETVLPRAASPSPAGGGILGRIAGLIRRGGSAEASAETVVEAEVAPTEIKVNRIGEGANCSFAGGVKRCTVGSN